MNEEDRFIKKEKAIARNLRKSSWWHRKIAHDTSCYYCYCFLNKEEVTMDHIVPLSSGGRSVKSNLAICCKTCNNRKRYMSPVDWILHQKQNVQSK